MLARSSICALAFHTVSTAHSGQTCSDRFQCCWNLLKISYIGIMSHKSSPMVFMCFLGSQQSSNQPDSGTMIVTRDKDGEIMWDAMFNLCRFWTDQIGLLKVHVLTENCFVRVCAFRQCLKLRTSVNAEWFRAVICAFRASISPESECLCMCVCVCERLRVAACVYKVIFLFTSHVHIETKTSSTLSDVHLPPCTRTVCLLPLYTRIMSDVLSNTLLLWFHLKWAYCPVWTRSGVGLSPVQQAWLVPTGYQSFGTKTVVSFTHVDLSCVEMETCKANVVLNYIGTNQVNLQA